MESLSVIFAYSILFISMAAGREPEKGKKL